jgi:phosphate-selective porin OprO and OprP
MTYFRSFVIGWVLLLAKSLYAPAQTPLPYFSFGKGLGITANDSSFSMNIRFRVQNRLAFTTYSESDLGVKEVEARIRRLRLRFDGFVYDPRLTYVIQLSFSRGDMDFETTAFPNIIRDAYLQYAVSKDFAIGIGQTKLPGNRQRITSSGDLQLADRSIVNSTFNLDRDFGVQVNLRKQYLTFRGAISTGEGRNSSTSDHGLAYTGRVELLPFGTFTKGSDYYEGDITREPRPKLSIAFVVHANENAGRTGGQLGNTLFEKRNLSSTVADVLFKYRGFAASAEYLRRDSFAPITQDASGNVRYIVVGDGQNYQASYVFKNNVEVVGRYSIVNPAAKIEALEKLKEQFTVGLNKYIKGHRVKLQNDLTLEKWSLQNSDAGGMYWSYRFQVEVGI